MNFGSSYLIQLTVVWIEYVGKAISVNQHQSNAFSTTIPCFTHFYKYYLFHF